MTERMELALNVQNIVIFVLMITFNPLPRVAGLILGNTTATSCDGSSANINFDVDLQTGTIPTGSEVWYYESTIIATKPSGVFSPQGNYTSRLHAYSTYGFTLDNITDADGGRYFFVFSYYSPTPQGFKTATASLTVNIAPTDNCSPSYKQSGDLAICELNQAANCGSPRLQPMWTNTSGNNFTVTKAGTYTCCANGSILMDCYRGSSTFCKTFQVAVETTSTPTDAQCKPDGVLFIILVICIIISCIIKVIYIVDLINWNRNSKVSIFKMCVKTGHRCLRILYLVLLITDVACVIVIIIIIIIGRQCQVTFWLGLGFVLFIIIGDLIFLIVLIKFEVIIRHKDTIQNPRTSTDVKITASLRQICISDVEWIGPNGNILTTEGKCIITPYNSDTGETSLTITNVSWDDNGSYICQSKNGCKLAKDSIHILCDKGKREKSTGSSSALSRKDVQIQMAKKHVMSDEEERPPAVHTRTQNKVESKAASKQTIERPQPLPPVGGIVEDKLKPRKQPSPPENSYAKDPNLRGLSANFEDAQGLPTGTPRPNRLTPLTPKQATAQEEDAPEEKTKRKKNKKKKSQMNEVNQKEEMVELKSQRTSPEDQSDVG